MPDFQLLHNRPQHTHTLVEFPFIFNFKVYLRITCETSFACECSLKPNFQPSKTPDHSRSFSHLPFCLPLKRKRKKSSSFPCVVFIHCSKKAINYPSTFFCNLTYVSVCVSHPHLSAGRRQASRKVERKFPHFLVLSPCLKILNILQYTHV